MQNSDSARILIVDDQIHALHGVSRIMKGVGYETFEASNGADCLKLAAERKPDLILLDVALPDIDGREVCRRIKSEPETADIYVVLFSSVHIGSDCQAEGLEHGADGYIARPIPNRELVARVKSILRLKYAEARLRESEESYRRISSLTSDIAYSCIRSNNTAYSIDWIMGAVERITGHSEEDIKALGCWRTLVIDEDRAIFDNKVIGITPGSSGSCELRLRNKSGRIVWVASSAECVLVSRTPDGLRLYGGLVDITERKMAEEALRISEDKFSKAFYLSPDAITITRLVDGMIVSVNEGFKKTLGYAAAELIANSSLGIDMWDNPEDRNRWTEKLKTDGKVDNFEACFRSKDGDFRYGLVSAVIITINREEHILTIGRDITERKRTEEALRESEEKYRLLVANSHDIIYVLSAEGIFSFVSPAWTVLLGHQVDQVVGQFFQPFVHPDDVTECMVWLQKVIETGQRQDGVEYRVRHADGSWRWHTSSAVPFRNEAGMIGGFYGIAKDITERKRLEEAVKQSEVKYRGIFNNAAVGMMLVAESGRFMQGNSTLQDMLGYTDEEIKTLSVFDITPPEDIRISKEKFEALKNGATSSYRLEKRYVRKDGALLWVDLSVSAIRDSDGRHIATIGVISDITRRKRAEEALRLSEVQKTAILNGITTNIAFVNNKLEIQWVNKTAAESVGRSPEEMIGSTCHSLWADPERPCENCPTLRAFQTKKSEETIMTTPDGRVWNERGEPVIDDRGNLIGVVELAQDITEYRRLTEQEKWLVTAIEQAAEAVIITDPKGVIQYVNPAQEILSGYTRDELLGQTPNIFGSDKHPADFYTNMWETINAGKVWSGRFVNRKKDGTEYHEDATISPIYDESGKLTNFVAVKHDVTKQVTLQEQLLQAQKMEAIGTLAGGFAHDFNNKLQVIAGYVDLMLFEKDLPETAKSELEVIKQTVHSSAELIKGMMVFVRKTPLELRPIELNKLVAQTRSMLSRSMPKMIEIDLLLDDDLWTIHAAPNQIDQILMNLAINARDAMPDGGWLTIKTQNLELDEEFCRSRSGAKPGRYVMIEVSDTGTGMDKETASHIFEPFFTTKASGKGTGLGLAVVYGIVEQHNGWIICDSAPSVGSTFKIYFPAIEEVHEEECFEKKEPPRGKGETILLVDDEPDLLQIIVRLLNRANYRVITSIHGKDALELYEKHSKEIRLVILDLLMPGMGGKECLRGLLRMDPNSRVLMVSGYHEEGIAEKLKDAGAKGFMWKPFDEPQLLEKIREIIDEE